MGLVFRQDRVPPHGATKAIAALEQTERNSFIRN